jgi:hypothetical protein
MDWQNCAEPWMAEPKRPMDGLERVLPVHPQTCIIPYLQSMQASDYLSALFLA